MENNNNALITELSVPLIQAKFWIKLVAVMMIIVGVLYALTLVGIIVAWLPIWMGILLFQAASNAEQASMNGDQAALFTSLSKLKTYFTITGVLMLISIVATVLALVLGVGAGIMAGAGGAL